ncbi:MAG: hypothetical protein ABIK12_11605 [Pseudomonadota bacterium]
MCTVRLLEVLGALARQVRLPQDHQVLAHQAQAVKTDSLDNLRLSWDRDLISQKHQEVLRELERAALRLEPPVAERGEKG